MSAESPQFRDLTPQEENSRVMGIFQRNIRMDIILGESLSSTNQLEDGVMPQDAIDGIKLARRLARHAVFDTYWHIQDTGNQSMRVEAQRFVRTAKTYESQPPTVLFERKLGEDLVKFVRDIQGDEYEKQYIDPPKQHGFPSD